MPLFQTLCSYMQPRDVSWIGWCVFFVIAVAPIVLWGRRPHADHESTFDPVLDGVSNLKKNWKFAQVAIDKILPTFVTANHITGLRLPLVVATILLYFYAWHTTPALYLPAFLVHAFNAICDFIDGTVALMRGGSEFGKWFDPFVDKLVHALILVLISAGWLATGQYLLFAIFAPTMIASLAYAYWLTEARARRKGKDIAAKPHGKLKAVCESVGTCAILLGQWSTSQTIFLVDGWILLTASVFLAYRSLQSQSRTS